ncbi:MAG: WbuC family cupin fold metalloprotein [Proteobacteria bacterium]|nr:WbuC family cupin fold metalloprotein [Pseudomonadota bacterium]
MIKLIDEKVMAETASKALASPRLRMNYNYHELSDPVQRMLNAIEPESYIRPHRHKNPDKTEMFIVLKGRGVVVIFDNEGNVVEHYLMEAGGNTLAVEIPPGVWHSIFSLDKATVFLEVKDGPYAAISDKGFASWSPVPDDSEAAKKYLERLRASLGY